MPRPPSPPSQPITKSERSARDPNAERRSITVDRSAPGPSPEALARRQRIRDLLNELHHAERAWVESINRDGEDGDPVLGDRVKRLRATIQTLKAQDAERRAEAGSSGTADADRVTESFEDFQRTLDRAISEGRRNRQEALERNLESRGQQQEAIQNLVDASLGKVPSAAEIQQRFGLEQALSQQNALASRGVGSSALAGRQAALAGSRLQGQALAQGGALRAQEQAAARALLQRAISGQRGQDLQEAGMGTQLQVPSQGQLGSSISNLGQFFLGGQELELGRDKLAFQEEKFKQEMARAIENDEWGRVLEMIGIGTGFAQGLAGPAIAAGSRQKE